MVFIRIFICMPALLCNGGVVFSDIHVCVFVQKNWQTTDEKLM